MDGASLKQSQHRATRLIKLKAIVLILIAVVAIGILICAALGLVGLDRSNFRLDCPIAYRTWLGEI